jgi:hypothetical protein
VGNLSFYTTEEQTYSSLVDAVILRMYHEAGRQWLTPVILATQEAEIRKIAVQSQPRQIVRETLSQKKKKKPSQKKAGGVDQGVGPEFNLQYYKHTQKNVL